MCQQGHLAVVLLAALLALLGMQPALGAASGAASGAAARATLLTPKKATTDKWWAHAVIYQIYPRSFKDSDGDGIGDIKGITSKLDYLKSIGVGAIWLSPFYPSPQADFGYDIKDFVDVDPQYGTLADFDEMVKETHDRGMKVVVDFVPNHSSDEHEWFIKSAAGDPKYKDYYVWHEGKKGQIINATTGQLAPPNNWVSHFRFSAWTWNEQRKAYYLHQFHEKQPDLNYRTQGVVDDIKDVYRFWMKRGVDGFRIDAVPFLFEEPDLSKDEPLNADRDPSLTVDDYDYYTHPLTMDYPETYDMVQQWRQVVDEFDSEDRVTMTECYTTFDKTIEYYGTETKPGAHFTFNFQIISVLNKTSSATHFKNAIDQWLNAMGSWRWPNWVIGNHDNSRVATRYPNLADAMNMISLTLPGTAMTYNGEELGMEDTFVTWEETQDPQALNAGKDKYLKSSRDVCRTPHQWDDTTSAGFSVNAKTWLPTNPNYWQLNAKEQEATPRSHINVYKDLTEARKSETLKNGKWATAVIQEDIFMITRSLDGHPTFITLVNLGSWEKEIKPSDLGINNLKVYTSSINSKIVKGNGVSSSGLLLRPKEGVLLTNSSVAGSAGTLTKMSILLALVMSVSSLFI